MYVSDFINERPDGDLVMLCNEIYDWHVAGELNENSFIHRISKDFSCPANHVEELILDRAVEKLGKIVVLLLEKRSSEFFKSM